MKSFSARRKSRTSACRRFTSSTRKMPHNLSSVRKSLGAAGADVVAAAAAVADAVGEAVGAVAVAEVVAGPGGVAAGARSTSGSGPAPLCFGLRRILLREARSRGLRAARFIQRKNSQARRKYHKILSQVASHTSHTIKLLPAFVITEADCEWILNSFASVLIDSERVRGAIWSLGRTLVGHAMRASA